MGDKLKPGNVENSHRAIARVFRHARSLQKVSEATLQFARLHSESVSTSTKPAKATLKIRTAPQRERFDTHVTRRARVSNQRFAAPAKAFRHARNLQKVRNLRLKFARRHSESVSTRATRKGFSGNVEKYARPHGATARAIRHARDLSVCRRASEFARRHSVSAPTRTEHAEGASRLPAKRTPALEIRENRIAACTWCMSSAL